jgi:hypothetical protein
MPDLAAERGLGKPGAHVSGETYTCWFPWAGHAFASAERA